MTNSEIKQSPSVFDSYNAKWISAEEIAKSFIPPKAFEKICKPTSMKIVGPRGSGKTSIFKMLQTNALENWEHPEADKYRNQIDYTSIFVPSDVVWSQQTVALGSDFLCDRETLTLRKAILSVQMMEAFLKAVISRFEDGQERVVSHRRIPCDESKTSGFVSSIAEAWKLNSKLPSLGSLNRRVRLEINNIYHFANTERYESIEGRSERFAAYEFLNIDGFQAIITGIEFFNEIFHESEGKWAFLFDELEIAPDWLVELITSNLRSSGNNVIYKLSLSPFSKDQEPKDSKSPMKDNDFTVVPLWPTHKAEISGFSKALFQKMTAEMFPPAGCDPSELLGPSYLNGDIYNEKDKEPYSKGSKRHNLIREICDYDESVRLYLQKIGVKLDNFDYDPKTDHEIRKIMPTLILRDFFRRPTKSRKSTIGRKSYEIYSGTDTYFAAVESNPRWLIGITSKVLEGRKERKLIPASNQGKQIHQTAQSFCSLLKTIPIRKDEELFSESLLDIISKIGKYFAFQTFGETFIPEPAGSFRLDEKVNRDIHDAMGIALNAGAIVYMPSPNDDNFILSSLYGKRFRLSYLLSCVYRINTRIGSTVPLSKILYGSETETVRQQKQKDDNEEEYTQTSLFDM